MTWNDLTIVLEFTGVAKKKYIVPPVPEYKQPKLYKTKLSLSLTLLYLTLDVLSSNFLFFFIAVEVEIYASRQSPSENRGWIL